MRNSTLRVLIGRRGRAVILGGAPNREVISPVPKLITELHVGALFAYSPDVNIWIYRAFTI
jgi:hypothetical protein